MKLLLILFGCCLIQPITWLGNYNEALNEAGKAHKQILINFSGSDWCGPCIRLRTEILETEVFEKYASEHLILVRADFPRQKKNRLSAEQTKLNEALAERYNPDGKFPFTLLIDENGKIIKSWEGYPGGSPEGFVSQILTSASK